MSKEFGVDDIIEASKSDIQRPIVKSRILVVGVGGCGGNIADAMYRRQKERDREEDIGFLLCNTDEEALGAKDVRFKIILGHQVTRGKGAGGNPEVGEKAAQDSAAQIRSTFADFKPDMVFVTAGMGGGTGTGAAHVIAKIAQEMGILTVGVLTMPFSREGVRKLEYAQQGLEKAKENLDGRIVINNEELLRCGSLTKEEAYAQANEVLIEAASAIADIVLTQFNENIDFRDVDNAIRGQGLINIGTAYVSKRTPDTPRNLVNTILSSPLVADKDIYGSKNVIVTIKYGKDKFLMREQDAILETVYDVTGGKYEILKIADVYDPSLDDSGIQLTLIATGYRGDERAAEEKQKEAAGKTAIRLWNPSNKDARRIGRHRMDAEHGKEEPAYKRRKKNIASYVDEGKIELIEIDEIL